MRLSIALIALSMLALSACSDKDDQAEGYSKPENAEAGAPMSQSNMPAGHPGNMPPGHPGAQSASTGPAPLLNKELHPGDGLVKAVMHAGGYTYMEVEMKDKQMWVAATAMKVKSGDKVQWQDGAVMRNFTSGTLHRTFDEILFVSNASIVQ